MIAWTCREVSRLFAEGAYDEAHFAAKAAARLHLLVCGHCRRFRREVALLGQAVRLWARDLALPPEGLSERILSRLGPPS